MREEKTQHLFFIPSRSSSLCSGNKISNQKRLWKNNGIFVSWVTLLFFYLWFRTDNKKIFWMSPLLHEAWGVLFLEYRCIRHLAENRKPMKTLSRLLLDFPGNLVGQADHWFSNFRIRLMVSAMSKYLSRGCFSQCTLLLSSVFPWILFRIFICIQFFCCDTKV
jgi:hypothetical protein